MTSFKAFWKTRTRNDEFFFPFLIPNVSAVPTNSVPGEFGDIRQVKHVV